MVVNAFVIVNIIFAVLDLFLAALSVKKEDDKFNSLALCLIFSAVTILSYVLGMYVKDYHVFSFANAVYFVAIDWTLVFFFKHLTSADDNKTHFLYYLSNAFYFYAILDTFIEMINPFVEIAITYIPRDTFINSFAYNKMFLYNVHLFMSYVMILAIVVLLVIKCLSVPKEYRNQYSVIILGIVTIVFVNSFFLFIPGNKIYNIIDTSIIAYSVVAYFVYFSTYKYADVFLLKDLSKDIVEKSNEGIILFDYDKRLILQNNRAKELLKELNLYDKCSMEYFLKESDIPEDVLSKDFYSFQYSPSNADKEALRCDYMFLRNATGQKLGYLFLFIDVSRETDMLTGFQNYDDFKNFYASNKQRFTPPCTIVEMDITNLAAINTNLGKDTGDKKIIELAGLMRKYLPKDSYFIRGIEANLIAVTSANDEEIIYALDQISREFSRFFHHATIRTSNEKPDVIEAIDSCTETLDIKKMLDMSSGHSDILVSLIKALQESDSDTEEHVKRTQKMGARLGQRIGLNEYEMASLSLLCLLHDIGKIGIPIEILNKPGKLTEEEFALIKTHAEKGYQITNSTKEFRCISNMVLHHHERWDGKGYPSGLGKEEIPLLSRIISVVDAYDAIISDRSYRKGRSSNEALIELKRCAGSQFDPYIVSEFLQMMGGDDIRNVEIEIPEQLFKEIEEIDGVDTSHAILNTKLIDYGRYILNSKMVVIEADYNFEKLTGYNSEDIKYSEIHQIDLVPLEDQSDYLLLVNEILAKHQVAFTKHRLLRKDGLIKDVLCIGRIYYDSVAKEEKSEIFICDIPDKSV